MSEWLNMTLGDFVDLQRGHDLPSGRRVPGPVPVVGSGGITGWHNEAKVSGPGITIGRAANLGVPTLVEGDFWPLNTTLYVTDFRGNDVRFVYHLFQMLDLAGFNSGSVQPMLNRNYIKSFPIRVPGRVEQAAIAEVLWSLDEKIAVNERIASTADSLARTHYERERCGLVGQPERLDRLARVVVGSTPSRANPDYWNQGTVNWINSGKANEFRVIEPSELITEAGLAGSSVKMMPPGATLIGITGATMGQISRLEITAGGSQNVAGVWSGDPTVNDWLFYDIQARVADLTKHASGGAQQHINKKIITDLDCVVPDAPKLAAWHSTTAPLLARVTHALVENRTLAALRDTLLPQLMSARLRVRDAEKMVEDHV
ncbi:restriction endonuclease subunit S [Streptomyces sp. NPDC057705]|uniref:restriction endonuclease subunit S n=1 Tax=Streptomyces sp. NPDC057705 TaxID=3346222 RepID=UPI00368E81B7